MTQTTAAAVLAAVLSVGLTTSAFAQAPAPAQGRGGTPAPPQNLQAFPKDIDRQALSAAMRSFTQALGVECNYCHVDRNFAADDKQQKKTARAMIQLVGHANEMIAAGVAKAPADVVKVQCFTCHRGKAIPENPPPPPAPAAAPGR
ncbi:MAG: c-type cytochrome [Acidobacteriaceae bacterium]|jgi:hypothetical protein|nr:c-type cytochrome [Acidobacteriaceae bacterium]